jgi:hypothetical protein
MNLLTGLGLVMGILSTADLAYKYLSPFFKKPHCDGIPSEINGIPSVKKT